MSNGHRLEFIDFIVPIALIREKCSGGWDRCQEDHKHLIGGRVWHDDDLFRDGAMDPHDIERLVKRREEPGFQPT